MGKQIEIVSEPSKELCALTHEMATEAAEAMKTGLSKGFNNASCYKYPGISSDDEQLSKQRSAFQLRQTFDKTGGGHQ